VKYLHADGTEASFSVNAIQLLFDLVNAGSAALACHATGRELERRATASAYAAASNLASIDELATNVTGPLAGAGYQDERAKDAYRARLRDVIDREFGQVRDELYATRERSLALLAEHKRDAWQLSLEALCPLLQHGPLPNCNRSVAVSFKGGRCLTTVEGETSSGLRWVIDVTMPADHPLRRELSVGEIIGRDPAVRPSSARQGSVAGDEARVTELVLSASKLCLELSASHRPTSHEVVYGGKGVFVMDRGQREPRPYLPDTQLLERLRELRRQVEEPLRALLSAAGQLRLLFLDGGPASEAGIHAVVARLAASCHPLVAELTKHAISPLELSLKRQVDSHTREEVFVSRSELLAKLHELAPSERLAFEPLGLGDLGDAPSTGDGDTLSDSHSSKEPRMHFIPPAEDRPPERRRGRKERDTGTMVSAGNDAADRETQSADRETQVYGSRSAIRVTPEVEEGDGDTPTVP
jgi:hypothetical protein